MNDDEIMKRVEIIFLIQNQVIDRIVIGRKSKTSLQNRQGR